MISLRPLQTMCIPANGKTMNTWETGTDAVRLHGAMGNSTTESGEMEYHTAKSTLVFPDGRRCVGGLKNSNQDGQGKITSPHRPMACYYGDGTRKHNDGNPYDGE